MDLQGFIDNILKKSSVESDRIFFNFSMDVGIHSNVAGLFLNACAFQHGSTGFIAFTLPCVVAFRLAFDRILAEPSLLLDIGDPKQESAGLPKFNVLAGTRSDIQVAPEAALSLFPRDEARRWYSEWLTIFTYHFLIAHELAHIVNGHFAIPRRPAIVRRFSMSAVYNPTIAKRISPIALEVDADITFDNRLRVSLLWRPRERPG